MSFRLTVFRLQNIRAFLKRNRERFIRCIAVFGGCAAEVAVLQNLVSSRIELCLHKLLVNVAECLVCAIRIRKHFVCFFLVCAKGVQRNDRCSHRCKHAVVIVALYI